MCAEFTTGHPLELHDLLLGISIIRKIIRDEVTGRVFPRALAPILIPDRESNGAHLIESEFSLVPAWWNPEKAEKKTKNNRPVFATHNARIETIVEKPAFRDSFEKRHCLIPMSTFYESSLFGEKFAGNRISIKQSNKRSPGAKSLVAAGCFSEWVHAATGEVVHSFTIITSNPNREIFEAGHDRMPIFLDSTGAHEWLYMEKVKPLVMKDFLLNQCINSKLDLDISVDRALKDGWQRNSPEPKDIEALGKIVGD